MKIDIQATSLGFRVPQIVDCMLVGSDNDVMRKDNGCLAWKLEPDTVDGIARKIEGAIEKGYFVPAELATVDGPRQESLRIFAEVVRDVGS